MISTLEQPQREDFPRVQYPPAEQSMDPEPDRNSNETDWVVAWHRPGVGGRRGARELRTIEMRCPHVRKGTQPAFCFLSTPPSTLPLLADRDEAKHLLGVLYCSVIIGPAQREPDKTQSECSQGDYEYKQPVIRHSPLVV